MLRRWHPFRFLFLCRIIHHYLKKKIWKFEEIIAANDFESFQIIHKLARFIIAFLFSFTEIVPSFEPRDVTVKKGVDAKEFYDLLTEIGR